MWLQEVESTRTRCGTIWDITVEAILSRCGDGWNRWWKQMEQSTKRGKPPRNHCRSGEIRNEKWKNPVRIRREMVEVTWITAKEVEKNGPEGGGK